MQRDIALKVGTLKANSKTYSKKIQNKARKGEQENKKTRGKNNKMVNLNPT